MALREKVEIGERASMVLVARKVVAAKKMEVLGQGVATVMATAMAKAMEAVVMAEREVVKVAATKAAGSSAATKAVGSSFGSSAVTLAGCSEPARDFPGVDRRACTSPAPGHTPCTCPRAIRWPYPCSRGTPRASAAPSPRETREGHRAEARALVDYPPCADQRQRRASSLAAGSRSSLPGHPCSPRRRKGGACPP